MNYKKIYDLLVLTRQAAPLKKHQGLYLETHHIVPTCLGGPNTSSNKVNLTAREHYIAHLLLYKMQTDSNAKQKLFHALTLFLTLTKACMKHKAPLMKFNSRLYELLRSKFVHEGKGKLRIRSILTGEYRYLEPTAKLPDGFEYVSTSLVCRNGVMMRKCKASELDLLEVLSNAPNGIQRRLYNKRISAGWTLQEATTIPTEFKLSKQDPKIAALQKAEQLRKLRDIEKAQRQARKVELKLKTTYAYYNEYIAYGPKHMQCKYGRKKLRRIYVLFRRLVPEYTRQQASSKPLSIFYNGKQQSMNKWCKELHISKSLLYKYINSGMSFQAAFDVLLKRRNLSVDCR